MSETIRVLLADDHAVVRAGIRQFLEYAPDIEVVAEASDGAMAQTLISEKQPDIAILDIQMPHISGINVTRWIRATYPNMGVLVLTAYDDDPYIMAVLQAGANGYVLKTASPAKITQAVHDVYAGKSALDSAIAHKLVAYVSNQHPKQEEIHYDVLTARELEALTMAGKGYTNKAIGVQMGISARTVQGHLAKTYSKLQVNSRTEAVMRAVSLGLIEVE